MADIFREIDEDLRRERLQMLWKRFGSYVIGAALGVILSVAGYQGWTTYTQTQRNAEGERFTEALIAAEQGNIQQAEEGLTQLAADAGAGYQVLARLRQAGLRAQVGDGPGAKALYEQVAADSGVDPNYRALATIFAALYGLEGDDPALLTQRLEPLTAATSEWRYSATELLVLVALRAGDQERGVTLLKQLTDDTSAPRGLRGRAAALLAVLGG